MICSMTRSYFGALGAKRLLKAIGVYGVLLTLVGGLSACTEDETLDEGNPSITVSISTACGNKLPVTTIDELSEGNYIAATVLATGSDPGTASRMLLGPQGEQVPVTFSVVDSEESTGKGRFASSRAESSEGIKFIGKSARDQFFCTGAGVVYLTAEVQNYTPGGGKEPIASLTPLRPYPVICMSRAQFDRECGLVDASTPFDMAFDAGEAEDGGADFGVDGGDADVIAPWSISFVPFASGNDTVLGIRGSGGMRPDSITVSFRVTELGRPVPGVEVDFEFTGAGAVGGAQLLPNTTVTNSEGIASTNLVAGTIPGTLQVRATATRGDETAYDVSRSIVIRGGIPSARTLQLTCSDEMILAFSKRRDASEDPLQANPYVMPARPGTQCRVTLGDRLQGRLDRDTRIFFLTEAGTVDQEAGINENGQADFEHRINNPPPVDVEPLPYELELDDLGHPKFIQSLGIDAHGREIIANPRDGLVRIVAYTRGEEDFIDNDADGIFTIGTDTMLPGMDLPEPFVDADDNEEWTEQLPFPQRPGDPAVYESYRDSNGNGIWDVANNRWDANTEIWTSTTVLWVGEPLGNSPLGHLRARDCDELDGCSLTQGHFGNFCHAYPRPSLNALTGAVFTVRMDLRDANGNCPGGPTDRDPASVSISASNGLSVIGGATPVHYDGRSCFGDIYKPRTFFPEWLIMLEPQNEDTLTKAFEGKVTFEINTGRIGGSGAVTANRLTQTLSFCY